MICQAMFVITKKPLSLSIAFQNASISGKLMSAMMAGAKRRVVALLGKKCLRWLRIHKLKKHFHHNQDDKHIDDECKHGFFTTFLRNMALLYHKFALLMLYYRRSIVFLLPAPNK